MLHIENCSKYYKSTNGDICVFKHINLQIQKGERVVIYGESGSGKTTLLHCIAGLEKPSEGAVFLYHKNIYTLSDKQISQLRNEKIGMIFQEFYLDEKISVIENVLFPKHVAKKVDKTAVQKAEKMLEEVGLADKKQEQVKNLSGGQKQRVAIARALINNPEIILADEPTANLDKKTAAEIMDLIWMIHKKRNCTIVLVTHDTIRLPHESTYSLQRGILS